MDFWTRNCASCIKNFPKVDQLQKEFKEDVQFIVVAPEEKEFDIGAFYRKLASKYNLQLVSAYDSTLFRRFGVQTVPHVVIIDPKGIVRAVTFGQYMNKENIQQLLAGNTPYLKVKLNRLQELSGEDYTNEDIHNAAARGNEMFSSTFSRWNPDQPSAVMSNIDQRYEDGSCITSSTPLDKLFNIAYFGKTDWEFTDSLYAKVWPHPVVESQDSVLFETDYTSGTGLYNYKLSAPVEKATNQFMQQAIQCDLKKYFQLTAVLEERMMPVWELVVTDKETARRLKTKSNENIRHVSTFSIRVMNDSMDNVLALLSGSHPDQFPMVNATGIEENVDLQLDVFTSDFREVRKVLNKNGLDLRVSKRKMIVLVLK